MYEQFGLVLTVTHACNLRCGYCYAGAKSSRTMDPSVGRRAIDRAVAHIDRINAFLRQDVGERSAMKQTREALLGLAAAAAPQGAGVLA